MIDKKEKLLWIAMSVILILLFLLSSTDLLIKEQKKEVYPISVILDDASDANYLTFRKGMEMAAAELNVDMSLITLYEDNDSRQQIELMLREQQDGAQALIVTPVELEPVEDLLLENRLTVPLIVVGEQIPGGLAAFGIVVDRGEMGHMLAEWICRRHEMPDVYLFSEKGENAAVRAFANGLVAGLTEQGVNTKLFVRENEHTFHNAAEELTGLKKGEAVVVALDHNSLMEIVEILEDSEKYRESIDGVYGRGNEVCILNALDRGMIDGLCVIDEFCAGYLSVCRAVEAVKNQLPQEADRMESFYIEKKDLRNETYEKMLYPIE